MRKAIFFILLSVFVQWSASSGQPTQAPGAINQMNRLSGLFDAPIIRTDGSGAGANAVAQYFLVHPDNTLTPIGSPLKFRGTTGALAKYFDGGSTAIPGTEVNQIVTLRLRAWEGASWETAMLRGESPDFQVQLGGGTTPAANPAGVHGFTLTVPDTAVPTQITREGSFVATFNLTLVQGVQVVLVQTSTNLSDWTTISTNRVLNGLVTFSAPANQSRNFYRSVPADDLAGF